VAVNIGYLWLVKDAQFERRAAPTAQLLSHLRGTQPRRLLISDFPLNPWIAKMTTRLVPGWAPEMLLVNDPNARCPDCLRLRWNAKTERYDTQPLQ
jgi:hypothetical protein